MSLFKASHPIISHHVSSWNNISHLNVSHVIIPHRILSGLPSSHPFNSISSRRIISHIICHHFPHLSSSRFNPVKDHLSNLLPRRPSWAVWNWHSQFQTPFGHPVSCCPKNKGLELGWFGMSFPFAWQYIMIYHGNNLARPGRAFPR
jgi:hypothetical protein